MSKSLKLKDNNYLDVAGIVYNRNILKHLIDGTDGKGFSHLHLGNDTSSGCKIDQYGNLNQRTQMNSGNWHIANKDGTTYLRVDWDTGRIRGLNGAYIYKEYTLYNDNSGTNGDIALSDSVENYNYIEIFFRSNDNAYNSVKVFNPNNKNVSLCCGYSNNNNPYQYFKHKIVSISNDKITCSSTLYTESRIGQAINTRVTATNNIYITRVCGYK